MNALCDHMGHANLRVYGEFFEQALWHVFHRIGITPSVLRGETIRMAGVQHEKQHVETGEVCATCELTAVCIDAKTRKPREFPSEISSKAKEIL